MIIVPSSPPSRSARSTSGRSRCQSIRRARARYTIGDRGHIHGRDEVIQMAIVPMRAREATSERLSGRRVRARCRRRRAGSLWQGIERKVARAPKPRLRKRLTRPATDQPFECRRRPEQGYAPFGRRHPWGSRDSAKGIGRASRAGLLGQFGIDMMRGQSSGRLR